MRHLDDAIQRQQAVQRKRTFAWALFGILLPVSLLFWSEVVFGLCHLSEIGILQLLAEFIVSLEDVSHHRVAQLLIVILTPD